MPANVYVEPPAGIEPAVSCVPNRCPASWAWVASVEKAGLEPASAACKAAALPLSYDPEKPTNTAVEKAGLEPASAACRAAILPLNYIP